MVLSHPQVVVSITQQGTSRESEISQGADVCNVIAVVAKAQTFPPLGQLDDPYAPAPGA
jgi:hypothetical protein